MSAPSIVEAPDLWRKQRVEQQSAEGNQFVVAERLGTWFAVNVIFDANVGANDPPEALSCLIMAGWKRFDDPRAAIRCHELKGHRSAASFSLQDRKLESIAETRRKGVGHAGRLHRCQRCG